MIRLLLILILLFSSIFANKQNSLKVVFPKNFPPSFYYINEQPTGYGIDLMNEIAKDLNLDLEYVAKDSWAEVVHDMKLDKLDIIPNQGITEDRKKYMNFSKEVQSINVAVFSFIDKKILGIASLDNKKIAVIKSNIAHKILSKNKKINLQVYEREDHFLDDFVDGHIDYIAYTEPAVLDLAKNNDMSEKIIKNFDLTIIHRAIGVSKKYPELLENINESLDRLKENGKLDQIYDKWHKKERSYTQAEIFQVLVAIGVFFLILSIYLKYKKIILTRNELEKEVNKKTKLLEENRNKLEFMVETVLSGYWEFNVDANEIKCSNKWFETLGLNRNDFTPSVESIRSIIHMDDTKSNENAVKRLINGDDISYTQELRLRHKSGKYFWVQTFGTIYKNIDNQKIFFGFLLDINEKKELEEKRKEQENMLLHQSKMASMGEMLENIAHQWRQPLSMISTSATGVEFQKEVGILTDDYLIEAMKNINDSTQYLSHTIDDFRNYFNTNKQANEFEVNEILNKVLRIISSKLKNCQINVIIDSNEVVLYNLENELIQVIINLLNNAKDALEENSIEQKFIFINLYKKNDLVVIKVKDNALGIKDEVISKIFEPYFTTKHKTQGTGLGLFMCQEILSKHMNGSLSVKNVKYEYENKSYKGAEFTVELNNLS